MPKIDKENDLPRLFRCVMLISWNEAPTTYHHAIEAIDIPLRDIMGVRDLPFGGKLEVFSEDF